MLNAWAGGEVRQMRGMARGRGRHRTGPGSRARSRIRLRAGLFLLFVLVAVSVSVPLIVRRPPPPLAPDFRLPEASGGELVLGNLRGKPVILVFYRNYYSPPCREQMKELGAKYQAIKGLGGELVFISVDDLDLVQAMKKEVKAEAPILSDSDFLVSRRYGVFNRLGDGLAAPAVFIIDRYGYIRWKYIAKNITDRPGTGRVMAYFRRVAGM